MERTQLKPNAVNQNSKESMLLLIGWLDIEILDQELESERLFMT